MSPSRRRPRRSRARPPRRRPSRRPSARLPPPASRRPPPSPPPPSMEGAEARSAACRRPSPPPWRKTPIGRNSRMASVRAAVAALPNSGAAAPDPEREFAFSKGDFEYLAALAYERAGISLSDSKRNLVYGRLSRRLRALELTSFSEYRAYPESDSGEIERFINSISTNHARFFREVHHFTHFRSSLAATFAQQDQKRGVRRLRIWSAGCSTGEEPYTIALVLRREIADMNRHDVKILATDIDTDVLAKASRGEYAADALDHIPDPFCRYFKPTEDSGTSTIKRVEAVPSLF